MKKSLVVSFTALAFASAALYAVPALAEETKTEAVAKPALPDYTKAPYEKGGSGPVRMVLFNPDASGKCAQVYDTQAALDRVILYAECENNAPASTYFYAVWMSRPEATDTATITYRGYKFVDGKWVFDREDVR